MKRNSIAAIAAVLLAIVAGLTWRLLQSSDENGGAPALSPGGPGPGAQGAHVPSELSGSADSTLAGAAAAERVAAGGGSDDAGPLATRALDPDTAHRVHGSVLMPLGVGPDDSVVVRAVIPAPMPEERPNLIALFMGRGALERWLLGRADREIARAEVGSDGRYELLFEPTLERVWLDVDARWMRLPTPVPIELGQRAVRADLEPLAAASVKGRLIPPDDANGSERRFDESWVWLMPANSGFDFDVLEDLHRILKVVPCDIEGNYELRGLQPDKRWNIVADPQALGRRIEPNVRLSPGETRVLDLELPRGGSLAGIVVDERGDPVPGAEVLVSEMESALMGGGMSNSGGFASMFAHRTHTAADGRFELSGLPVGEVQVRAEKAGYKRPGREKVELTEAELVDDLEIEVPRGRFLDGRVSWGDGRPAADVLVRAGKGRNVDLLLDLEAVLGGSSRERSVRTGPDGRFVLGGLGLGRWTVIAQTSQRDGNGRWRDAAARMESILLSEGPLEMTLETVPTLFGTVSDPEGAPVESFQVRVISRGAGETMMGALMGEATGQVFEGVDGMFRLLGLEDGEWTLRAEASDFGISEPLEFELPADLAGPPLALTLRPAAALEGRVLDTLGVPIAGARIGELQSEWDSWSGFLTSGSSGLSSTSGVDGSFSLDGLNPGTLVLFAELEGYIQSEPVELSLMPGETLEGVLLELRLGGGITGLALDLEGRPLSGARIRIYGQSWRERKDVTTDSGGRFEVDRLEPGNWTLQPEFDDDGDGEQSWGEGGLPSKVVEVFEGQRTEVTLGGREAEPARVHGIVRVNGEPFAASMDFQRAGDASSRWRGAKTRSSEQGEYSIELVPGEYRLEISGEGSRRSFEQLLVRVPQTEEYAFDVELSIGSIAGRVFDGAGEPMAGIGVSLRSADGRGGGNPFEGDVETDERGAFRFAQVRAGTWSVRAGGDSFRRMLGATRQSRAIVTGIQVAEGQAVEDVMIVLDEPGAISGQVTDAAGLPIGDANVFARAEDGTLMDMFSTVSTDVTGNFRYSGLAPGRYTLSARSRTSASGESGVVSVRSGDDSGPVRLTLEAGATLTILSIDEDGFPQNATVSVHDSQGRRVDGMRGISNADGFPGLAGLGGQVGRYSAGPLAPGTYTARAQGANGSYGESSVHVSDGEERELQVVLVAPETP